MKRMIVILLILTFLLGITACTQEEEPILEPVSLYYRRINFTYGAQDSVISSEVWDAAKYKGNLVALMNDYLKGGKSDHLARTFPSGVTLLHIALQGDTADLTLNSKFANLSGINLTIACACLAKTTMELTGAKTVVIHLKRQPLNGMDQIVMDESTLLLLDESINSPD